jgi:hypothetical protein
MVVHGTSLTTMNEAENEAEVVLHFDSLGKRVNADYQKPICATSQRSSGVSIPTGF